MKYCIFISVVLMACSPEQGTLELQDSLEHKGDCSDSLFHKLQRSKEDLETFSGIITRPSDSCRIDSEKWELLINDTTYSAQHRVNALFGLLRTSFKPGMPFEAFIHLADPNVNRGISGNLRVSHSPLWVHPEDIGQNDVFYHCYPMGKVNLKDSLGAPHYYRLSIHLEHSEPVSDSNSISGKVKAVHFSGPGWGCTLGR